MLRFCLLFIINFFIRGSDVWKLFFVHSFNIEHTFSFKLNEKLPEWEHEKYQNDFFSNETNHQLIHFLEWNPMEFFANLPSNVLQTLFSSKVAA